MDLKKFSKFLFLGFLSFVSFLSIIFFTQSAFATNIPWPTGINTEYNYPGDFTPVALPYDFVGSLNGIPNTFNMNSGTIDNGSITTGDGGDTVNIKTGSTFDGEIISNDTRSNTIHINGGSVVNTNSGTGNIRAGNAGDDIQISAGGTLAGNIICGTGSTDINISDANNDGTTITGKVLLSSAGDTLIMSGGEITGLLLDSSIDARANTYSAIPANNPKSRINISGGTVQNDIILGSSLRPDDSRSILTIEGTSTINGDIITTSTAGLLGGNNAITIRGEADVENIYLYSSNNYITILGDTDVDRIEVQNATGGNYIEIRDDRNTGNEITRLNFANSTISNTFLISGGPIGVPDPATANPGGFILGQAGDTVTVNGGEIHSINAPDTANITGSNTFTFNAGIVLNNIQLGIYGDNVNISGNTDIQGDILGYVGVNNSAGDGKNNISISSGTVRNITTSKFGDTVNISGDAIICSTDNPEPANNALIGTGNSANTFNISGGTIQGNIRLGAAGDTINYTGGTIERPIYGVFGVNDILNVQNDYNTRNKIYAIGTINVENANTIFTVNYDIGTLANPITNFNIRNNASVDLSGGTIYATTLTNEGTIYASSLTETFVGNYVQNANTGAINVNVNNNAALGKINITGGANLNNGKIELNIPLGAITTKNVQIDVIQSTTALQNANNVSLTKSGGELANTAVYTFTHSVINNNILRVYIEKSFYDEIIGNNSAYSETARALNTLETKTLTTDMRNVLTNLADQTDETEIINFIKQSSPELCSSFLQTSFILPSLQVFEMIEGRMGNIRSNAFKNMPYPFFNADNFNNSSFNSLNNFNKNLISAVSSLSSFNYRNNLNHIRKKRGLLYALNNEEVAPENIWVQFFGNTKREKAFDDLDAFKARTIGFGVGIDSRADKSYTLGVNIGYAKTQINSNGVRTNALIVDNYQISLYGMYNLSELFIEGIFNYGRNRYDSQRDITSAGLNRTATANYNGDQYIGKVKIGYTLWQQNIEFVPSISLQYSMLDLSKHTELNANSLSLQDVNYKNIDSLIAGIGARFSYHNLLCDKRFIPFVSILGTQEITAKQSSITTSFAGGDIGFKNDVIKAPRAKLYLGTGFRLFEKDNVNIVGMYNYELTKRGQGHSWLLKFNFYL